MFTRSFINTKTKIFSTFQRIFFLIKRFDFDKKNTKYSFVFLTNLSKSVLNKCTFCICIIGNLLQKMKVLESKLENAVVITCNSTDQVNGPKKNIDLQLKNHLREIFDCMIYRQMLKAAVSIATCCKQLLGFSECAERRDRGTGPHYRSEIHETVNVKVFQSILNRLQFLYSHFSLHFFA